MMGNKMDVGCIVWNLTMDRQYCDYSDHDYEIAKKINEYLRVHKYGKIISINTILSLTTADQYYYKVFFYFENDQTDNVKDLVTKIGSLSGDSCALLDNARSSDDLDSVMSYLEGLSHINNSIQELLVSFTDLYLK